MSIRANVGTRQGGRLHTHNFRGISGYVALVLVAMTIMPAAATEREVRETYQRFVAAQNAHDLKEVESLLLESPNFLWITRGTPIWGRADAVKRFGALYKGTWRLAPEESGLKIVMIGDAAAHVYVPILFTIGAPGQRAQQTRFLFNQVLVKTAGGWKVSSILPIPAPTQ
jgi:ketosteroid isomerase-like protein